MKKLIYFIIALIFISALPEISYAQSNDPFEQQTMKARGNATKREKKIKRKQDSQAAVKETTPIASETPVTPITPAEKPQTAERNTGMTISNPCDEWLGFELVSVVGSKGSQKVTITAKFTNNDMNKSIGVGHRFLAYDCDGEEHTGWTYSCSGSFNTVTGVPVKFVIEIPGKINPATTKVMPVISFDIDKCRIEMKNVPINWK